MASILVVDDDPDVLDTMAAMLRSSGHQVTAAPSGVRALDVLDAGGAFDLLITDIVMPGLHGFNLARMATMRRRSLAVLYLTGFVEQSAALADQGERLGELLIKPVRADALEGAVDRALRKRAGSSIASSPPRTPSSDAAT
jgi:CheY-like chemotaxis protein